MRSARASNGGLLAGLAAIVLGIDTWQTWYALRIPPSVLDQVDALSNQLGSFGGFIKAGLDYARHAAPIGLSAHDVFHSIDVILVLICVLVVGVVMAASARGRPVLADGDGSAVAGLGAVAFCLIAYRMIHPPGPSGLLALRPGIWVGLVAAGLICLGGLIGREQPVAPPSTAPARAPDAVTW